MSRATSNLKKAVAKRGPDEQKPHTRQPQRTRGHKYLKSTREGPNEVETAKAEVSMTEETQRSMAEMPEPDAGGQGPNPQSTAVGASNVATNEGTPSRPIVVTMEEVEPEFSDSSYGFRRGRSTHQAIVQAQEYVRQGYDWVVDIDLEKFFDTVNHDILMARIAKKVADKRILKLLRAYLQAGIRKRPLSGENH